jgi:hypothetical protein
MAQPLEIDADGFLFLVDGTLNSMVAVLTALGDDLVNETPDLEGANSPYSIVNHCIGVARWWSGQVADGHEVYRDREHEWTATGSVAEIVARVPEARAAVAAAVAGGDGTGPNRGSVPATYTTSPIGATRGIALLHVYEELVQHLGQMEITRDILLAGRAKV